MNTCVSTFWLLLLTKALCNDDQWWVIHTSADAKFGIFYPRKGKGSKSPGKDKAPSSSDGGIIRAMSPGSNGYDPSTLFDRLREEGLAGKWHTVLGFNVSWLWFSSYYQIKTCPPTLMLKQMGYMKSVVWLVA